VVVGEYLVESLTSNVAHSVSGDSDDFLVAIRYVGSADDSILVVIDSRLGNLTEHLQVETVAVGKASQGVISTFFELYGFLGVEHLENFSLESVFRTNLRVLFVSVLLLEVKHVNERSISVSGEVFPLNSFV
jgi:hypothetical protein